ncbi:uncharacterized protein [Physcomitrium patens]|uniref:uncharacterized protein isoform X6 n=1 Tax=Physcomitrium patens TaxID=3218 RepID=UPI003CCE476B
MRLHCSQWVSTSTTGELKDFVTFSGVSFAEVLDINREKVVLTFRLMLEPEAHRLYPQELVIYKVSGVESRH